MRRSFTFVLLFIPLAIAIAATLDQLRQECSKLDPKVTNFTCKVDDIMKLHILKQDSQLTKEQSQKANVEFDRIIKRYIQLGGEHFEITASWWPANAKRMCTVHIDRKSYYCNDCVMKNGECEKVQ